MHDMVVEDNESMECFGALCTDMQEVTGKDASKPEIERLKRRTSLAASAGSAREHSLAHSIPAASSDHKTKDSGRRASFLDERRTRLAQRSIRVEEIVAKSRATKDSNICNKLNNLRESLTAAEAARSAIYAKIAAQASREVAKAKAVSRAHKEKERIDLQQRKDAIRIKFLDAERRREEQLRGRIYKRKTPPSSREVSPVFVNQKKSEAAQTDILNRSDAAITIQRFWRHRVVAVHTRRFLDLHLVYETVSDVPFEVMADFLKSKDVIDRTARLLTSAAIIEQDATISQKHNASRTFLSTFMILGHPTAILKRQGEKEQNLVASARDLANAFSSWITRTMHHDQYHLSPIHKWNQFTVCFQDWKAEDSAALVEVMVAQYVELDLIWQIVKDDTDPLVAQDYHTGIRENQVLLLSRIRRLAGNQTRPMVRKAVMDARKKRGPKHVQTATRAAVKDSITNSPHLQQTETFNSLSLGRPSSTLSNRQLIHELALNPAFQLTEPELKEEDRITEATMRNAFFEGLAREIRVGKHSTWVPVMVQEVKVRLLRLVKPGSPTFKTITDAFDVPFVEQQCRMNCYDLLGFTDSVIRIMKQLCAPVRDTAVSDLSLLRGLDDAETFSRKMRGIFDGLDVMLLDSANYHLSISAPRLIPEAIPYERVKFQADIDAGVVTLDLTRRWLTDTYETLLGEAQGRDIEAISHLSNRPTSQAVFTKGFISLISNTSNAALISLPETMSFDQARLSDYRSRMSHITRIATYLATAKNIMRGKSDTLNPITWLSLKDRLMILISNAETEPADLAAEINNHLDLASVGLERDRGDRHALLNRLLARTNVVGGDPVLGVLTRRLESVLREAINNSTAPIRLSNTGLDELSKEVESLATDVSRLAKLNGECYASWYDSILLTLRST